MIEITTTAMIEKGINTKSASSIDSTTVFITPSFF
jgi:hypothetical protein